MADFRIKEGMIGPAPPAWAQRCLTVHLLACSSARVLATQLVSAFCWSVVVRCALYVACCHQKLKCSVRGVWEQVLEQWREVILRQHWTDDYKIVVHGGDGRALDVNRHVFQLNPVRLSHLIIGLPRFGHRRVNPHV
jgi:hypothetical protein